MGITEFNTRYYVYANTELQLNYNWIRVEAARMKFLRSDVGTG